MLHTPQIIVGLHYFLLIIKHSVFLILITELVNTSNWAALGFLSVSVKDDVATGLI